MILRFDHGGNAGEWAVDMLQLLVKNCGIELLCVQILTWVGAVVLHALEEFEEARSDDSSKAWTSPVDPMFSAEGDSGDARAEAACRVERTTGVIYPR